MNIDEALALLTRAKDEVRRSRRIDIEDMYVATQDGIVYILVYVEEGDWHGKSVYQFASSEEWNRENITWRQTTLNRHGGWAKRRVRCIHHGNAYAPSRVPPTQWDLSCGHTIMGVFHYGEADGPVEDGALVPCGFCRDAGYGLDIPDPMTEEKVTA